MFPTERTLPVFPNAELSFRSRAMDGTSSFFTVRNFPFLQLGTQLRVLVLFFKKTVDGTYSHESSVLQSAVPPPGSRTSLPRGLHLRMISKNLSSENVQFVFVYVCVCVCVWVGVCIFSQLKQKWKYSHLCSVSIRN